MSEVGVFVSGAAFGAATVLLSFVTFFRIVVNDDDDDDGNEWNPWGSK